MVEKVFLNKAICKKSILIAGVLIFFSLGVYGESEGEKLFKENNPAEAAVVLEQEIENGTASGTAYNYLGLSYFQLGDYEKSIEAFTKGLKNPATNKKILSFNLGNSCYAAKNYADAAKYFGLAYTADPSYYGALLNRANSYLMGNELSKALEDYSKYLELNPFDEQAEEIGKMIEALKFEIDRRAEEERIAAEEAERIAEEERKIAEEMERQRIAEEERIAEEKRLEELRIAEEKRLEEERIAEERRKEEERLAEERRKEEERIAEERRIEAARKAEEAERRRKLLEDVANSLHNTDSTNLSSGAEDLIEYDQESELD